MGELARQSRLIRAFKIQRILYLSSSQLSYNLTEGAITVTKAIGWYEQGLDFADALHLASSPNAKRFVTFDDKLSKKAKLISPIPVDCI